jgi:hypothetical protein
MIIFTILPQNKLKLHRVTALLITETVYESSGLTRVKLYLQSRQLEYEVLDQWNGATVFIKLKGRHRKQTKSTVHFNY